MKKSITSFALIIALSFIFIPISQASIFNGELMIGNYVKSEHCCRRDTSLGVKLSMNYAVTPEIFLYDVDPGFDLKINIPATQGALSFGVGRMKSELKSSIDITGTTLPVQNDTYGNMAFVEFSQGRFSIRLSAIKTKYDFSAIKHTNSGDIYGSKQIDDLSYLLWVGIKLN